MSEDKQRKNPTAEFWKATLKDAAIWTPIFYLVDVTFRRTAKGADFSRGLLHKESLKNLIIDAPLAIAFGMIPGARASKKAKAHNEKLDKEQAAQTTIQRVETDSAPTHSFVKMEEARTQNQEPGRSFEH